MEVFTQGPCLTFELTINEKGIEACSLLKGSEQKGMCLQINDESKNTLLSDQIRVWIIHYAMKTPPPFELPLNFDSFPPFTSKVLRCLSDLPFGTTASYGEVAQMAGSPKAFRAVGNACNRNPFPLILPCHRVIGSGKKIGGFAMDLSLKKCLLDFENSKVKI